MKKSALNAALGLAALLVVGSSGGALATTYDFRYDFAGDGVNNYVTGSFTGTGPSINDITDIDNVTMALNGVALPGSFSAWSYTPSPSDIASHTNCGDSSCFTLGGAVVSADSSLTNFVFSTASDRADLANSNYFYIIQPWYGNSTLVATQYAYGGDAPNPDNYINYQNGQFVANDFTVTAVPEPAAWAMMIMGMGAMGVALRRRRSEAFVPA